VRPAELPDQVAAGHRHDASPGKTLLHRVQRSGVLRAAKHRHDHAAVDDQEVHVTAGQTLAVFIELRGRQFDRHKAIHIAIRLAQDFQLFRHRGQWRVVRIVFH
jgi:hypothetical protein